jgi:hypothetical protein
VLRYLDQEFQTSCFAGVISRDHIIAVDERHVKGMSLVNTWEEEIDGKKMSFKDSFVDISPSSFTVVSEGLGDGAAIWHVTTRYTKQTTKQPPDKR